MHWESNSDFATLGPIREGSIVHLRFEDGFNYLVKAVVLRADSAAVEVVVDSIFDGNGQGEITAGKHIGLLGSTICIAPHFVHRILSRQPI